MKKNIEILIVEDSKTQAEELKYFLETNNYKVQHANNGEEALAMLKQKVPDIIISDIVMPKINGYELCKRIKSDENLKKIPIILLTSLSGPEEIFKSLKCKADSFVSKPYSEDFLITRIKDVILNLEGKGNHFTESGFEIVFDNQKHLVTSNSLQIIDLLLSTNKNAAIKSRELDKTNKELALVQHKLNELNKNLEDEVKVRTERIEHLNMVLSAIRNVNQLIVQEKDRKTLIKKACENFVEIRDFQSAWVALLDDEGKIIDFAGEGFSKDISKPDEKILRDYIPYCLKEALKTDDIVLIKDMESDCQGCPWLKLYKMGKWGAMSVGLKSGGKCYGVLNISLHTHYVTDNEYQSLFMEVAGDIAFALYSMELEDKHKQAEEALKESQRYTRGLIEANLDALVTISAKGMITDVNSATELFTGMSRKELIGTDFSDYSTDPDATRKGYQQVFRDGYIRDYPLEIKHRDGKVIPALYNATVYKDKEGNVTGVIVAARDITERKRTEEKIKEKSHFLESLIQQSPLPTFVIDSKGFNVMVNEAFLKFYAVPNKKMILGRNALTEPANISQGIVKYFKEALSGKIVEIPEIEFVSPYKNKKTITRCRMFPIVDTTDTLTNVVVMQEDITEQKQAEKELAKHREHLEELVKERTRELEDKNKELERFNKLFIGREFRIKELRNEIKELKKSEK